jgi:hypothetical protein
MKTIKDKNKTVTHRPRHCANRLLLSVLIFSVLPFFMNVGSPAMLGGLMVFFACIAEKYVFQDEKPRPNKLYHILLLIILVIGVTAVFIVGGKEYKSIWTPMDNLLSTYMGAFFGIMVSHLIISFIDGERAEKHKQRELDKIVMERQKEQRIISKKEKEGLVAIKKDGKLIGYIEKEKYYQFVEQNIKNEN